MRDDNLYCPHCEHEFDQDDHYNCALYNIPELEEGMKIKCPSTLCKKEMWVQGFTSLKYASCTSEEYEKYDDIEVAEMLRD